MRRWNGWGDDQTGYPLPATAAQYLEARIGPGCPAPDASLPDVLATVPPSRLPYHPLISAGLEERVRHARGQSLPDWIALRSGVLGSLPDGVAYPLNHDHIRQLLAFAHQVEGRLIPYGGGTSVVGHLTPPGGAAPVLTIDLSRMHALLALEEQDRLATFEAGVSGPDLERQLSARGYTLGHFPQSFELSTLGGWIATRSSGQQSYYYGRIEDLFAGGHVETPGGPLDLACLPASAAGPDLRQVILGSEGRLGIITRATVRVRPLPAVEAFYGVFFRTWNEGLEAARVIAQARLPVSMVRVSDSQETETTLALSGKGALVAWANQGLRLAGYGSEPCLMVLGITGDRAAARWTYRQAMAAVRAYGGLPTGQMIGKIWRKSRFLTPYLRNTLWERGYALDTVETALPWSHLQPAALAIKAGLRSAYQAATGLDPEPGGILIFAHLSHLYRDGGSVYITFIFPLAPQPEITLDRWQACKAAASRAILHAGGTISHQHGVGADHASYLETEKGPLGVSLLRAAAHTLDPEGVLNPGKLVIP